MNIRNNSMKTKQKTNSGEISEITPILKDLRYTFFANVENYIDNEELLLFFSAESIHHVHLVTQVDLGQHDST